jgi:hypothetical protein
VVFSLTHHLTLNSVGFAKGTILCYSLGFAMVLDKSDPYRQRGVDVNVGTRANIRQWQAARSGSVEEMKLAFSTGSDPRFLYAVS